jgi:hypothetical protein
MLKIGANENRLEFLQVIFFEIFTSITIYPTLDHNTINFEKPN